MISSRNKDADWFGWIVIVFLILAWSGGAVGNGNHWTSRLVGLLVLAIFGLAGYGAVVLISQMMGG